MEIFIWAFIEVVYWCITVGILLAGLVGIAIRKGPVEKPLRAAVLMIAYVIGAFLWPLAAPCLSMYFGWKKSGESSNNG